MAGRCLKMKTTNPAEYYKPVEFQSSLLDIFREDIKVNQKKTRLRKFNYITHSLSNSAKNTLDAELVKLGYPLSQNAVLFHWPENFAQGIHVDVFPPKFRHTALNFNLSSPVDLKVQWFRVPPYLGVYSDDSELSFDDSELIYEEITPACFLMKTNIPHRAITNHEATILSIRFFGNPLYEDLCLI